MQLFRGTSKHRDRSAQGTKREGTWMCRDPQRRGPSVEETGEGDTTRELGSPEGQVILPGDLCPLTASLRRSACGCLPGTPPGATPVASYLLAAPEEGRRPQPSLPSRHAGPSALQIGFLPAFLPGVPNCNNARWSAWYCQTLLPISSPFLFSPSYGPLLLIHPAVCCLCFCLQPAAKPLDSGHLGYLCGSQPATWLSHAADTPVGPPSVCTSGSRFPLGARTCPAGANQDPRASLSWVGAAVSSPCL